MTVVTIRVLHGYYLVITKVYEYKVVSTSFNDDIYI
jgi:hypothetical protein